MVDTLTVVQEGKVVLERQTGSDSQALVVKGDGIEVHYWEVDGTNSKSKAVKRLLAYINGVSFERDDKDLQWKKSGRGSYKNKQMVLDTLHAVDQFVYEQGYFFERQFTR
ncbi:hypothetical protein [Bacillus paranthracis]|uniref:hypothetical protein n=1 Tax=Bacillus paranthracis TaxID=2026186 RepID=UPI0022E74CA6|nr:hypothetical protein [Bacillus paranthracis]